MILSFILCTNPVAIKKRLSVINWDNPKEALMSIAGYVENYMGGSSGAVSTLLGNSIFCRLLHSYFLSSLTDLYLIHHCWSRDASSECFRTPLMG